MRKMITLTLVLALLASLFVCVPAEARVYEDYPYIYLDFEENNLDQLTANGEVATRNIKQWTAGGANGTNGCISLEDKGQWENSEYYLAKPLIVGQTYRVSVWVRITTEDILDQTPQMRFLIYTRSHDNNSAVKQVTIDGTPAVNQWVQCSGTFLWDGMAENEGKNYVNEPIDPTADMRVGIRLATAGSGATLWHNLSQKDPYKGDDSFVLQYDMDDIVVEPVIVSDEPVYDDSYILTADFEDGTNAGLSGIKAIENDSERGSVALVESPVGSFNSVELKSAPLKFNHLYKISCWIKRTDDLCEFNGTTSNVDCINMAQNRMDKTNISPTTDYPTISRGGLKQNQWQYFEYYLKYDVKTFDNSGAVTGLRVGNTAAAAAATGRNEKGLEGVTYYLDDYFVQDLGYVQNGDFEHDRAEIYRVKATGVATETDTVFGWQPEQATSSVSTDVRSTEIDPESTSTQSMKVDVTTNGGRVYQGINFENGKEYKITFWAKGLNMAADEEKPISIVLDRNVDATDKRDVYEVPDTEVLQDEKWVLTDTWQKYEYTFSPNYQAAGTPDSNVIPRTPFMYFDVDGNKAGTQFLIDDITFVDTSTIVEPEVNPYPYIDYISPVEGDVVESATVTLSYNFVSDVPEMMEGESVVRALMSSDGMNWGCIGQSVADFGYVSYVIPEIAVGKLLKLEIAPMDEDYQMGEIASVELGEVKKSFEIVPEITKWDEATGEVAASVFVENNLSSLGDQNVVVILALYDDNNTLIKTEVLPVTITVGYSDTVKISAVSEGAATSAKLYVWSGTSLADAGETSYCEAVSYTK